MMKKVSSGECCHVVQMVGCVSTALPLALALEFVPFGDLLSYLKYWRKKVCKASLMLFSVITLQLCACENRPIANYITRQISAHPFIFNQAPKTIMSSGVNIAERPIYLGHLPGRP